MKNTFQKVIKSFLRQHSSIIRALTFTYNQMHNHAMNALKSIHQLSAVVSKIAAQK